MEEGESCTLSVPEDFEEKKSFLVNFSNGRLIRSHQVPKFTLYKKEKDKTKRKKILVAETEELAYIGTNFHSDNVSTNSGQYCIGALDRSSGIMKLYKTEMMTLHPRIPGTMDVEVGEEIDVPQEKVDFQASVNQHVSLFGSERRKRAFSAAQKNKIESDVLESALEPAFSHAEASVEKAPVTESPMQSSGLMPPYNPAAEVVQDVYDINGIVTIAELKILQSVAEEFSNATSEEVDGWRTENRYPEYILQHILQLPSTEPHRNLKASILLYANFLIQMHNMNSRKVQRAGLQFQGVQPPVEVLRTLLDKFAEDQDGSMKTYSLPVRMKDKIRLYLLVLCLIIDDFSVEFSVLQKDLKITTNKMAEYFRALGCQVKTRKSNKDDRGRDNCLRTGALVIPLSFPKPRKGKKRKDF